MPRRAAIAEPRLSAADWEAAALDAIAEHGIAAVAVEPLARRLGVTKGSFYWHFADRDALLAAALRRWEHTSTERIIAAIEPIAEPRERLVRLIRGALGAVPAVRLQVALVASSHPTVRAAVARVTRRRLAYLETCYVDLGQPVREARRSALLAYTAYVGIVHLRVEAPGELPRNKAYAAFVEHVVDRLVP